MACLGIHNPAESLSDSQYIDLSLTQAIDQLGDAHTPVGQCEGTRIIQDVLHQRVHRFSHLSVPFSLDRWTPWAEIIDRCAANADLKTTQSTVLTLTDIFLKFATLKSWLEHFG